MTKEHTVSPGKRLSTLSPVSLDKRDPYRAALEELKRNSDVLMEYADLKAKLRRQAFLEYVQQGFTEAQALELCKHD